jgi:hypothetical protein
MRTNLSKRWDLDELLVAAIIASWPDLMPKEPGSIHVEYDFAETGSLNYLQVWSSTRRGYWQLICTYCVSRWDRKNDRVIFENGYLSKRLSEFLEILMQHQDSFTLPPNRGRQGLLQITAPVKNERVAAILLINEVRDALSLPAGELRAA